MSYILDALRRADAERERGAVPGLQSAASPATDESEPARGAGGWRWPLAGVAVVAIGALGWWLGAGSARPEAPPPVAAPPALPPAPMAAPPQTAPATLPPPAVVGAAPAPAPAFLPPPPVREPVAAPRAASATTAAAAPALPAASAPARPGAPASAATPARLPTRDELPDELRRALPPLAVGGLMYSENADKRMVILDGRLLREGEAVGSGLVLEQIRARSAVLTVQGTRFELKF